jgi:hypothetical protein
MAIRTPQSTSNLGRRTASFETDEESYEKNSVPSSGGGFQAIIDFSSKALHHYLLLHEKLMQEKDIRLEERALQLSEKKQTIAELESYVRMLEKALAKAHDSKPEGWR